MITKEQAIKAANERWHPTIPKATHSGILNIGGQEIACDVLEDGTRVLRQKTFLKSLGRGKVGSKERGREESNNLPIFLQANNLAPYFGSVILERGSPIRYKGPNNQSIKGYDASLLPETCKVYVQAFNDGVLQKQQIPIAKICQTILYGLATVGIISLIDDATNYVEKRNRDELQKILEKYISEELRVWTKKFPNEFFKQIYRLHGWEYHNLKSHPQYVGKIINKHIYDRLPPGVLEELKKINPVQEKGFRKHRHHQFLTEDFGEKNLNNQIMQTITLMKVSDNFEGFEKLVEKINPSQIIE